MRMLSLSLSLALCLTCQFSFAEATASQGPASKPPRSDIVFWVSGDRTLNYPADEFRALPDEHQTYIPMASRKWASQLQGYYLVAPMINELNGTRYGWTFLLQTHDFFNLSLVRGAGDPTRGNSIFWPAHPLMNTGRSGCNYAGVTHYDEQYAAPGTVLQDPTQPPGTMIMIYESEIHCPYSPGGGTWVSVGIARSKKPHGDVRDLAQIKWPEPVAARGYENNWLDYGNGRYAGLTIPGVSQTTGQLFYGDSLPSAFIDDVSRVGDRYLYVLYRSQVVNQTSLAPTAKIHIARAKLGARNTDQTPAKLQFQKWYNGGWNGPGIQTNMASAQDDGLDPPGCGGAPSSDSTASIVYNEALRLYMMVYVCGRVDCSTRPCKPTTMSWYYRTTDDLSTQHWGAPHLIENSTYAITTETDKNGILHRFLDGGYPTFMTPGCAPGHIGLNGYAFLLKGDPNGKRVYASRKFQINPGNAPVREPCGNASGRRMMERGT